MYKSISINDVDFNNKLIKIFREDGLCVINDVINDQDCDNYMDAIINDFVKLDSGIKKDRIDTWITHNLPPQTRTGLFQALVSNLSTIWQIRSNDNIRKIFEILYTNLRGKEVKDFIVSNDAINIKPNNNEIITNRTRDWAHIDQTDRTDIFKCIQGQCVLTNTTASFVASPKSHLLFLDILNKLSIDENDKSNWIKFNNEQLNIVNKMINDKGYDYQIPILSKKGSFIVWSSTLIHSARIQTRVEKLDPLDKYLGWRGVVYVCYRPKIEFSQKELNKRRKIFNENSTTNHWSTKVFPKKPGNRWQHIDKKHPNIETYIKEPKLVYNKIGKPVLNNQQLKLLGF